MGKLLKINDRNQSTDPRSSRQNKQGKQLSLYVLSVIYLSNFYLLPIYLNYAYAYHIQTTENERQKNLKEAEVATLLATLQKCMDPTPNLLWIMRLSDERRMALKQVQKYLEKTVKRDWFEVFMVAGR